ncbi:hypothetical protein AAFC00_000454 [Neodothiora populina]|uniref:Ubiquinone biosynthesis monooxygenase COQ6, mitochondrial n=1 Tax=Neodothiora populina TaxID=2781224 RepID=A0ABR3PDH5_9PEZI
MPLRLSPRTPCDFSMSSWRCSSLIPINPRRRSFWSHSSLAADASHSSPPPSPAAKPDIYDIVCVGGGPAGLSLLTALRSSPRTANLKIALVESQDLSKSLQKDALATEFSNRCSSLTPGSVKFLRDVGALDHITSARVQPYHSMQVWDGVSGSSINFDPVTIPGTSKQGNVVAYMTENPNTVSALLGRLATTAPIDIFDKTRVDKIELGQDTEELDLSTWPVLSLSNSRKLAARLLIGADGANSPVRGFANIPSRGWDYDRQGVVATLQMRGLGWGGERHKIAYQRFLPSGPVALLPLPNNHASLVWSTTPDKANLLKRLSPADFLAMVNAAFRLLPVDLDYMHTITSGQADEFSWRESNTTFDPRKVPQKVVGLQEGSVASFPLRMRHADTYIGHRVALLGDAAHTVHPLAGQGLNSGLGDAQSLAKHIGEAVAVGKDIGSSWALEPYNAEQWPKNNIMLGTVDKLHKLYSAGSGPVVWVRTLGLEAVDKLPFVKGFFMKQATRL